MIRVFFGGLLALTLLGCELIPKASPDKRENAEQSIFEYKSDSTITLSTGSSVYPGMIATNLDGPLTFTVTSKLNFDYAIIETCHRDIVIPMKSKTNRLTYTINFLPVELDCKSAIIVKMFEKSGASDWALIAIRTDETLETESLAVQCNGVRWTFKGYTTCNHKHSKPQRIGFKVPIVKFKADDTCDMTKIDDKTFELRPKLGECVAVFNDGERWHTALFIGFEREFIR